MAVRAVRGAIQVDGEALELIFQGSPEADQCFPAAGARGLGFSDIQLVCAGEIAVGGSMPGTVRLLAEVDTAQPRSEIRHAVLDAAGALNDGLQQ